MAEKSPNYTICDLCREKIFAKNVKWLRKEALTINLSKSSFILRNYFAICTPCIKRLKVRLRDGK